jgi:hypothetical protein
MLTESLTEFYSDRLFCFTYPTITGDCYAVLGAFNFRKV